MTPTSRETMGMMEVRAFREADRQLVGRIDASSRCAHRACLTIASEAITWCPQPITPLIKTYDVCALLQEQPEAWDCAFVACQQQDAISGFAAVGLEPWNQRARLWHLFVDQRARRRGAARALIGAAVAWAVAQHARQLWLETQDTNCAAITAYERLGFTIVGLDRSLYANPPAEETAVFMSRSL
jgi:ribosomal protein S18 acetylase RimI-like enzyme